MRELCEKSKLYKYVLFSESGMVPVNLLLFKKKAEIKVANQILYCKLHRQVLEVTFFRHLMILEKCALYWHIEPGL